MKITHTFTDITEWFFDTLETLLSAQSTVMVGLWGWTSFDVWYTELIASEKWHNIDIQRVSFCVTDERVNCHMSDRNDEHIWSTFFVPFIAKNLGLPQFIRPDMQDDGGGYFARVGHIDIALFGMGPDGHTASLFPHHIALMSESEGFIKIDNAPKFPPERISLSPKSIQALQHVCLFAVWHKKEALANFLDEAVDISDCPARLLKPEIVLDLTD